MNDQRSRELRKRLLKKYVMDRSIYPGHGEQIDAELEAHYQAGVCAGLEAARKVAERLKATRTAEAIRAIDPAALAKGEGR